MKKKVCFLMLTILMFICFLPTNIFSFVAKAEEEVEQNQVLSDTEMFNVDTGKFNENVIKSLLWASTIMINLEQDLFRESEYYVDDFNKLATVTRGYDDWKNQVGGNVENFYWTIGGLKWTPAYISKDKNGNSVMTFWLNESKQDAWSGYENGYKVEEDSTASFYNGSLYSTYSVGDNYMYSTSDVRSYALNNANDYVYSGVDENENPVYKQYTPKENHPFALFTMPDSKLTEYIVTPSQMVWQEYQAPNAITDGITVFEYLNLIYAQIQMFSELYGDDAIIYQWMDLIQSYSQILVQYVITPVNEGWTSDLINDKNHEKIDRVLELFLLCMDTMEERYTTSYNEALEQEQTAENKIIGYDQEISESDAIIAAADETIALAEQKITEAETKIENATTDEERESAEAEKIEAETEKTQAETEKTQAQSVKSQAETNKQTAESQKQTATSNKENAQVGLNEIQAMRSEASGLFEQYYPYVGTDKYGNSYNFKNAGGLNYQDEEHYSDWKDDYLWLPSISEVGITAQSVKGIWGGSSELIGNGTEVVEEGLNYSNNTLLRSGSIEGAVHIAQDGRYFSTVLNSTEEVPTKAYAIRPAFNLNITKIINELSLDEKKSQYVYVDEIWDQENQEFNLTNLSKLYEYISGIQSANVNDLSTLIEFKGGAVSSNDMRGNLLASSKKTENKDIIVKIGGYDWHVVYMSKNKNAEPILTVWMENSYQTKLSHDKNLLLNLGTGTVNGSLVSISDQDPIYGNSLMRILSLNNSGKYYYGNDENVVLEIDENGFASYTASASHPFAMFTVDELGFTKYLSTPRDVLWQELQNFANDERGLMSFSNEAWSEEIADETEGYHFSTLSPNYAGQAYNSAWADDYLWLPSLTEVYSYEYTKTDSETGAEITQICYGLWELNSNQIQNFDGFSKEFSFFTDETIPTDYNLRTSLVNESDGTSRYASVKSDGSFNLLENLGYGNIRPAMHLNLSELPALSNEGVRLLTAYGSFNAESHLDNIKFLYDGKVLNLDSDYTLQIFLNDEQVYDIVNAGNYSLIFNGLNDYSDYENLQFSYRVDTIDLTGKTNIEFVEIPEFIDGVTTEVIPTINIFYGETLLIQGTDYDVTFFQNTFANNKAEYVVTYKGNYEGSSQGKFVIPYIDISVSVVERNRATFDYSGQMHKYSPGNIYVYGVRLVENVDYIWYYNYFDENGDLTQDIPDSYFILPGTISITIEGVGNYKGSREIIYTINKIVLDSLTITYDAGPFTYNGQPHTPEFSVKFQDEELVRGVDYLFEYFNNVDASNGAEIVIDLQGIYTGRKTCKFVINPLDIKNSKVKETGTDIWEATYTTNFITLTFKLIDEYGNTINGIIPTDEGYKIGEFAPEKHDLFHAGTYYVECYGRGNYTGTKIITVIIHKAPVIAIEIRNGESFQYNGKNTGIYKGNYFSGTTSLHFVFIINRSISEVNGVPQLNEDYDALIAGTHFSYNAYRDGVLTNDIESVGTIEFEILELYDQDIYLPEGSNFRPTFSIYPDTITKATISSGSNTIIYDRAGHKPTFDVSSRWTEKLNREDYNIIYKDSFNQEISEFRDAGTYRWEITSNSPNYIINGEIKGFFTITPKELDSLIINYYYVDKDGNLTDNLGEPSDSKFYTLPTSGNYTGLPLDVDIHFNSIYGYELQRGIEYSVTTDDSKLEEGIYTITISTFGNYKGSKIAEFYVNQYRIKDVTAKFNKTYYYNYGEPVEIDPNDLVLKRYNYYILEYGVDYTFYTGDYKTEDETIYVDKYLNNINAGISQVFIQGIGDYAGVLALSFNILQIDINDIDEEFSIPITEIQYMKKAITPKVSHDKLVENNDFSVEYVDNILNGTAKVVINGINNFYGEKTLTFEILAKNLSDSDIYFDKEYITSMEYCGSVKDIRDSISLYYETIGANLELNVDYELWYTKDGEYNPDGDAGVIGVGIFGINGFSGWLVFECEIFRLDLTDEKITYNIKETYVYQNGYNVDPKLKFGSTNLERNKDYIITLNKKETKARSVFKCWNL